MKRVAAALVWTVVMLWRADASADEPTSPEARVEWSPKWRRFRPWEYVATAGLEATSIYVRWYEPPPARAKWVGGNVFDDTVRGWLRADSLEGRLRAGRVSDWISNVGTAFPFAVDLPVALLAHRRLGVAWQMLMMDLEATALANLVNNLLFYEVGRGRPSSADCAVDPTYDPICGGTGNNASLPSGHTVTIATATGLTCTHHRYLPLYGSKAADTGVCVAMVLATTATGVSRIIADRHYATDVLLGATIGFGSGFGLPWLLHYRSTAEAGSDVGTGVTLLPVASPGSLGLAVVGIL